MISHLITFLPHQGIEIFSKKEAVDHFPDLRPFLYREKSEDFTPLIAQLQRLLQHLDGVEYYEKDPYIMCYIPSLHSESKPPNRYKQQCCQILLHITAESTLFNGLCHHFPRDQEPEWPIYYPGDIAYSPENRYLWVTSDEGKPVYSDGTKISFDLKDILKPCRSANFDLTSLPLEAYYPIILLKTEDETATGILLGLRSKITGKFAETSLVSEIAEKAKLST